MDAGLYLVCEVCRIVYNIQHILCSFLSTQDPFSCLHMYSCLNVNCRVIYTVHLILDLTSVGDVLNLLSTSIALCRYLIILELCHATRALSKVTHLYATKKSKSVNLTSCHINV